MMQRLKCGGAVVKKARTKRAAQYKNTRFKMMTTKKMMTIKIRMNLRIRRFKDAFAASRLVIPLNSVSVILIL